MPKVCRKEHWLPVTMAPLLSGTREALAYFVRSSPPLQGLWLIFLTLSSTLCACVFIIFNQLEYKTDKISVYQF